jgi:protein tyrosine phosphatase
VSPNFTVQPQNVRTTAGTNIEFTCQATGNPQPLIKWYKDGEDLRENSTSFMIMSVNKSHEGQYRCTATNVVNVVSSKNASLTVLTKVPTFVKQPKSQTVNYGSALRLTCPTQAHPPPKIQWLKNGIPLQGAIGDTLVISSFTDDDNGRYSCNATNTLGYNISAAAEVFVYREAPTFIQQPEGARLFVGDPFNMTCIAKGVPDPTYKWYKRGIEIRGANSSLLVIKSITLEDSTYYFCVAKNVEGRTNSRPLYLLVLPLPTASMSTTSSVTSTVPTNGINMTATVNVSATEMVKTTATSVLVTSVPSQTTSTISATSSSPNTTTTTNNTAKTPFDPESESLAPSVNIAAVVAPVVVSLGIIIAILVALLLVQRHRQHESRHKSNGMDRLALTNNIEFDVTSELDSTQGDKVRVELIKDNIKSSADLEQLLGRTPTYIHRISKSCPMNGIELRSLLERVALHPEDSEEPHEVKQQFEETPSNMVTIQKTPAGTESKNRYMNVLPNPHSAVRLVPLNEDPTTTYINANYVRGYNRRPKAYIATQGPIPSTRNDFWRMIWEQHVSTIIMTTGLVERGRMKCCRYWPDTQTEKEATYGNYTVRVVDENPDTHYAITTLTVKDNNQGEDHDEPEIRTVKHYWFTGWPDFGIPRETGPVLDFLAIIQKETAAKLDPVLVHCSAGIGRTGTFMAIELGMQQYLKEGVVDPLQYMCSMRQDRGGSIQTADQYLFIHKALADFIARVAK